ncbi:Fusarisetin A cluster transcription factor fsa6 [Colletotrichum sp. SAR11_240]|nr:Fusarisetin A cluster transcription factor fsa6 [Colletotrichum sp. SAR11_240]
MADSASASQKRQEAAFLRLLPAKEMLIEIKTTMRQAPAVWRMHYSRHWSIVLVSKRKHPEPQPKYLEPLVQCLIAADYVRGGPNIIECLIHYYLVEFYLNPVTEVGNWMVAGMIAQLAIRMGYHRDPSDFPRISAFEGEIRRRVWATVHIFDTTMAMLVGAPRIISDGTWNTRPPGNILDADLDDMNCVQLPASRADTEVTEVSFLLARYKMSLAMGRLVDLSLANKLESQEDVQDAEAHLKTT